MVKSCLADFSTAVPKRHDQGNLEKQKFIAIEAYSSRGWVPDHNGGKPGSRKTGMVLEV